MMLRSQRNTQPVTSAGSSQVSVAATGSNSAGSRITLPRSTPTHHPNNPSTSARSTHQPAATQNVPEDLDGEYPATQVVASGRQFSQGTVLELGNVDAVLVDQGEPPASAVVSRVSLLRRELAQLSNLYPSPEINEEPDTQVVGSGAMFSNSQRAEMENVSPRSTMTDPATQVVASARFSDGEVEGLRNVDAAGVEVEEADTQVVISPAFVSREALRELVNDGLVLAKDEVEATQIVSRQPPFSERMLGELGNVDLGNIGISPPAATANNDDSDYGYDEGSTIRYESETEQSGTITDPETIPDSDTNSGRVPVEAQSQHSSDKSWASGSLTSSMRIAIGKRPKPLRNGKVRPVPEELGTPPPRYPCLVTITHYTCGHAYKNVKHHDRCMHDDSPSEKVLREATPEAPVLDEWGLPPSGQRPGRMPCMEKETILLGGSQCEVCMAEE